jgi:hypothetical protein
MTIATAQRFLPGGLGIGGQRHAAQPEKNFDQPLILSHYNAPFASVPSLDRRFLAINDASSSYVLYRDGRDLNLRAADQTRNLPRNRSCISPHLANRTSAATRISAEESAGLHQSDRFPAWDRALPASQSAALSASACREWLRSSGLAQSSLPASGRYSASVCQGDPR